ncbi:NADPH-dependent F420 reductase [Glutamicibacter sp.]|jgi:Predicted dinucleotide-binding enzymes|nr:NAD(P)-binding domain-containing protein [Glutamicibacter sp.]HJX79856.1 NAD(P)-binding domain-containing protein [Glutamicibacter sp.]
MRADAAPFTDRIGILGAGRAGTALARAAATVGIPVNIASSRSPSQMKYHLAQYAPQATAVEAKDIGTGVSLVVLMVPQDDLDDVDVGSLAGLTLIDATNRWDDAPLPGWLEDGLAAGRSSSEVIAEHFHSSRLVKALNHISHWDLDSDSSTLQTQQRALALASDYKADAALVARLVSTLGFTPVLVGELAKGGLLEPEGEIFNQVLSPAQLRTLLHES